MNCWLMASGWELRIHLKVLKMNPSVRISLHRDAEVAQQKQKVLVISSALLTTLFHPAFFEKESNVLRKVCHDKFETQGPRARLSS